MTTHLLDLGKKGNFKYQVGKVNKWHSYILLLTKQKMLPYSEKQFYSLINLHLPHDPIRKYEKIMSI